MCDLDESLRIQNFTTVGFGLPPLNEEGRNCMDVTAEEIRGDVGLFFLQNIDKHNDDQFSRPVEFVPVIQALAKVLDFKPPATTSIQ